MHWCSWSELSKPKDQEGMGFRDLCKFNITLLVKQGCRFIVKPDSLVACIFKAKYFSHISFWSTHLGTNPTYVWRGIFATRKVLEDGVGWRVRGIRNTVVNNIVSMVANLIDHNSKSWKEEVITTVFTLEEVEAIKCIPLSRSVDEDMIVWRGDRFGDYFIRSG
ncbi:hypothetical protein Gohar_001227 [Gossypium harknessii]|uniref:Reverse transcriptase zinc-binding domain-containing protein n=1 Tax=Gossypium harknessii TaxID=34285 RepID=A0A7J9I384_9ROSI|nr:hypothetical protein [Gossypium harknessii]